MSEHAQLLALLQELQVGIRDQVIASAEQRGVTGSSMVLSDGEGDTQYILDGVGEEYLIRFWRRHAEAVGGIVLVAEGLEGGQLVLPSGTTPDTARWRIIVDPIDGTRCLMFQKRSAWVLSAAAPNLGAQTRLSDVVVAVQTEIPTLKQYLCDQVSWSQTQGVSARRENRLTRELSPLTLTPSPSDSIAHGYAMLSRFFPGARDELAAIDEALVRRLLGPSPADKALCFEDQYASSGGQLYELMCGNDRFNADLRPALRRLTRLTPLVSGLCCHPYDLCTVPIARALGVVITDLDGSPLDMPLDLKSDISWIGYANIKLQRSIEPELQAVLRERNLLGG